MPFIPTTQKSNFLLRAPSIKAIFALFALEIIIAGLSMRSLKVRKLIFGKPEIIIENSKIDREKMQKNRFTLDELMQ